jgi:hypothetical protein
MQRVFLSCQLSCTVTVNEKRATMALAHTRQISTYAAAVVVLIARGKGGVNIERKEDAVGRSGRERSLARSRHPVVHSTGTGGGNS